MSASFPMLYDEHYHAGLIDLYSKQFSPLITSQNPEQTAVFSDITRLPSYLYHYLLSFPYRLITAFTDSFYVSVVSLRLINVAFVAVGLFAYRKLLIELKFKGALIHASLLLITLIPLFVHLAAHINYDNLIFLGTPLFLLSGLKILRSRSLSYIEVSLYISLGLSLVLVKFSFVPIFIASSIYISIALWRTHRTKFTELLKGSIRRQKRLALFFCSIWLIFSIGMFTERYLGSYLRYSSFIPACDRIHPRDDCNNNPVYRRDSTAIKEFKENPSQTDNIVDFTREKWMPQMVVGMSFTQVNIGSTEQFNTTAKRERGDSIPILAATLWILILLSLIFLSYSWREIKNLPHVGYFVAIFLTLFFFVWFYTNYLGYLATGKAMAIQPRYFLLLVPILMALIAHSMNVAIKSKLTKVLIFTIILSFFTQGGGITTYLVRSNDAWYWQRETIIDQNMKLKSFVSKFIKES